MPFVVDECENSLNTMRESCMFAMIFILFILSWISVAVVGRAIDNFTFGTLGLNDKSTYHTVVIALTVLAIEIAMIAYFRSMNIIIYDSSAWSPVDDTSSNSKNDYSPNGTTQHIAKHGDSNHINFSSIDQIRNLTKIVII